MKIQKKDVWKLTKNNRERLKGIYISTKKKRGKRGESERFRIDSGFSRGENGAGGG